MRYDKRPLLRLSRFLALALPSLGMLLAVFHFAWHALDSTARLDFPAPLVLGSWVLECVGLTALFLLIHKKGEEPSSFRGGLLDGLLAGWIAWVFRGPLLVLTLVGAAGVPRDPWWHITVVWLGLYTVCGLLLGTLGYLSREP